MLFPKRPTCRQMREEASLRRNRYLVPHQPIRLSEDDILLSSPEFSEYEQKSFDGERILPEENELFE